MAPAQQEVQRCQEGQGRKGPPPGLSVLACSGLEQDLPGFSLVQSGARLHLCSCSPRSCTFEST